MSLENLRDLMIVIAGIELTLLLIIFAVVGLLLFHKIKKTAESIKRAIRPLTQTIEFIRNIREAFQSSREPKPKKA